MTIVPPVKFSRLLAGASFNTNYGTPEAGYPSNPYPVSYSMNPVSFHYMHILAYAYCHISIYIFTYIVFVWDIGYWYKLLWQVIYKCHFLLVTVQVSYYIHPHISGTSWCRNLSSLWTWTWILGCIWYAASSRTQIDFSPNHSRIVLPGILDYNLLDVDLSLNW